jgi:sulfatase-modifying factor enzyme 1
VLSATVPGGRAAVQLSAKLAELRAGEVLVEFDYNLPRGQEVVVSAQNLPNFQFKGELPQRKGLPPGNHKLSAKYRPDWPAAEANIVVDPNSKPKALFHFDFGRVVLEKGEQDGVRFSINGSPPAALGADAVTIPLRPGAVTLSFEAEGFEPATLKTNIVADMRLALIAPRLAPVLGFIALASDPPGATIAAPVGKQWQTLADQLLLVSLPPGTYPFTANFKGLKPVSKSVSSQKGKTNRVDFPFLYGKVRLTSNLPGAVARDPLTDSWLPLDSGPTLILPDGHFDLAARDPVHGLPDEVIPLDLKGDRNLVPLNFAFKYGTVVLQSLPPTGVEVRTNGVRSGDTPLTNLFVKAGNVKYELYLKELKRSRTVSTNVPAGATCFLSADLTKEEARGYTNSVGMELVMVNEGYFIGRWEVSEEQYKQVMGAEDTRASAGSAKQPVTGVGWSNVLAFCAKLTALDNSSLSSHALPGWQYAIPGEKDWLSAAGASPDTYARAVFLPMPLMNIGDPSRNSTNEFGLFDMFGNVAEWCLGSNAEPITLGGSIQRARPSRTDFLRITAAQLGADAISKGNKVTGFRCVLRGKAQP